MIVRTDNHLAGTTFRKDFCTEVQQGLPARRNYFMSNLEIVLSAGPILLAVLDYMLEHNVFSVLEMTERLALFLKQYITQTNKTFSYVLDTIVMHTTACIVLILG